MDFSSPVVITSKQPGRRLESPGYPFDAGP
jgi:hypothetical protein